MTTHFNSAQSYLYALQLQKQGNPQAAAGVFQKILQNEPSHISTALQFARLLLQHQQIGSAYHVLQHSARFASDHFEYNYLYSALALQLRQLETALSAAELACKLSQKSEQANNLLGSVHMERNDFPNAIEAFTKAIKLKPDYVDPHNNTAWAYRALGDKEHAIQHFSRAYEIDPSVTEALSGILMLKRFTCRSEEIEEAESRLAKDTLKPEAKTELLFALGKAYEDFEDYDRAFQYFNEGNRIWHEISTYQQSHDEALFEQLKQSQYDLKSHYPPAAVTPIFVLGLPRSSTSLVEQILASHSQIKGAGELNLLQDLCFRDGHFDWSLDKAKQIRADYLRQLQMLSEGKAFVVDKMPQNFRFIGVILHCFPEAKIIHCQRNARDNLLSLFKHHFPKASHPYAYSIPDLRRYHQLYRKLMEHWNALAPERIINLPYRELLEDFEAQVRSLLMQVGLEFEDSCLHFEKTKRAIRTASSDQVRRGLYQTGQGQWRNYQNHLGELFKGLPED